MIIESLDTFIPMNNWILIKPDYDNSGTTRPYQIKNNDGETVITLDLDKTFEVERYACTTGVVVKRPQETYYNPTDSKNSVEWITDIELQEGDRVIYGYFGFTEAFREADPKWVMCQGEIYILVFYGLCILAQRNDLVIMLNGYTLIEPLEEELPQAKNLILPSYLKNARTKLFKKQRGIVRYLGSRNRGYTNERYTEDDDSLKVGDTVTLDRHCNIPLEYSLFQTFGEKGKTLYRVQRFNISGIITTEKEAEK